MPDEAVEAAVDYLPHMRDCESRPERECQCRHLRTATMRAALEVAAPYLMADAWERGREDGYHHRPNPYKETV